MKIFENFLQNVLVIENIVVPLHRESNTTTPHGARRPRPLYCRSSLFIGQRTDVGDSDNKRHNVCRYGGS